MKSCASIYWCSNSTTVVNNVRMNQGMHSLLCRACISYGPVVRPSIWLSHAGTESKRRKLGSRNLHRRIDKQGRSQEFATGGGDKSGGLGDGKRGPGAKPRWTSGGEAPRSRRHMLNIRLNKIHENPTQQNSILWKKSLYCDFSRSLVYEQTESNSGLLFETNRTPHSTTLCTVLQYDAKSAN